MKRWAFLVSILCFGPLLADVATGSGLRLLAPVPLSGGAMQLRVTGTELLPLTPDRAALVTPLTSPLVSTPSGQWTPWDGPRGFADGILQIEYSPPPDESATTPRFFVAREEPAPPPVVVTNLAGLREAVAVARPGTRILVARGAYAGGSYFQGLRGAAGRPIVIAGADPADPPLFQGGSNGIHLTDPEHVVLEDLAFADATGNGLNVDDGGSFDSPARGITLRRLRIRDVGPQGNRDGIKLSGVVDFRVEACTIERWGTGGSGIDMVGCHFGVIDRNVFRHTAAASSGGANGVQTKGGTREVVIRRNRFEHAGARGVNVGGSTGLEFFRPPLKDGEEHAEAGAIVVEGNTFIGNSAAVAFVGVDGAVVRFNTIYRPERWALRILQETTAPGFVPCRNGRFTDNIVAFHSTEWVSGGANVGPNTAPGTFQFARNWWYCLDAPARSRPSLPVAETAGVYGESPQFQDASAGDLRLREGSPARGVGADALPD